MNERKFFLLTLIFVLGAMAFLMVKPFLGYFIGAVILAFTLNPLYKWLTKYVPESFSSLVVVILGISMIVIPFSYAIVVVFEDARTLAEDVNRTESINTSELENRIGDLTGKQVDIESNVESMLNQFVTRTMGGFSEFVRSLAHFTIGLTLMLFLMYYMLIDGPKLLEWVKEITPLPNEIQDKLYGEMELTTWAVIKGHVLVAVVQGLIAGAGLAVAGIPNFYFWTFLMVLLGFIPIVGTMLVWSPASLYLILTGQTTMGVILALYGLTVVSLTDNFLRPFAVDRGANLHPAVILVGVIGGVYIFGAAGLFIGPIILGIFKSALLVFKNSYQDL